MRRSEVQEVRHNDNVVSRFTHRKACIARQLAPPDDNILSLAENSGQPRGLQIGVDLGTLVEAVHIGPDQPPWASRVVHAVVERFAPVGTRVTQSSMDAPPQF